MMEVHISSSKLNVMIVTGLISNVNSCDSGQILISVVQLLPIFQTMWIFFSVLSFFQSNMKSITVSLPGVKRLVWMVNQC